MKILVSSGDTNGIGLETFLKAISRLNSRTNLIIPEFEIFVNTKTLVEYIQKIKFPADIKNNLLIIGDIAIKIKECVNYSTVQFGQEVIQSGKHAAESIYSALETIMQGDADAILTLPISKHVLRSAGYKFPGHTELIASFLDIHRPLMILTSGKVRMALATIHIPHHNVQYNLKPEFLQLAITTFHQSLKNDFGILRPKIAILGLNPHAGENGGIGLEEIKIIKPVIESVKSSGIVASGPYAADGFFGFGDYKKFDGIMAMYHDQGLIPLKLIAQGNGVNFTAGLPIVRTSPDHGTAFPIAGKNIADCTSTFEAIQLAKFIVKNRIKTKNPLSI